MAGKKDDAEQLSQQMADRYDLGTDFRNRLARNIFWRAINGDVEGAAKMAKAAELYEIIDEILALGSKDDSAKMDITLKERKKKRSSGGTLSGSVAAAEEDTYQITNSIDEDELDSIGEAGLYMKKAREMLKKGASYSLVSREFRQAVRLLEDEGNLLYAARAAAEARLNNDSKRLYRELIQEECDSGMLEDALRHAGECGMSVLEMELKAQLEEKRRSAKALDEKALKSIMGDIDSYMSKGLYIDAARLAEKSGLKPEVIRDIYLNGLDFYEQRGVFVLAKKCAERAGDSKKAAELNRKYLKEEETSNRMRLHYYL